MNIHPNFMKMDIQKIRKLLSIPSTGNKKPLTEEQKRKRARFVVYPLFVLLFAGCLWLIYSPSGKELERQTEGKGFNTNIPSPEDRKIQGNKVEAYEREEMAEKEKQRHGTFQEMASLFGKEKKDTVRIPEISVKPEREPEKMTVSGSSSQSSVNAYRDMNRTLDGFYSETYQDSEKEELLRRIEELERKQQDTPVKESAMEEKMALMEKSYELAARYNGKTASSHVSPVEDKREHTAAMPVKRMRHQVVSSLSRPVSDEEFIVTFTGERNTDFHTPIGKTLTSDKNTIGACVHGTQTVSDGQALRIRLLEPMVVDDRFIPRGTVLVGGTRIEGERLDIRITAVEYKGTVLPVELEVYDADGQLGILVPNSMEYDAAREIAANMGSSMNSSINISTDAGAQIASDLGKGVIQGVSQYITKKMRTVKITLKAGHKLLLHSPDR